MNDVDNTYKQIIKDVLTKGQFKENRTGVSTISKVNVNYTIDNSDRFPLLTTKKMDGARWNSLVHELLWYFSGEHHIRNLQEHTSIWDAWADEDGNLDTAYGRFWREYPVPYEGQKEGETWNFNERDDDGVQTFDQIQYVINNLKENPNSRRHVVNAWHPANATVSSLPPCHLMFIFNVQNGDELHLHLTQRSGDVALGVPFNISSYCLLQRMIAQEAGLKPAKFHHTIVDAHVYCGRNERGEWWGENIDDMQKNYSFGLWEEIISNKEIPQQEEPYDHIPGLLEQMTRTAHNLPRVEIADKPIDNLEYEDFELKNYESHDSIEFAVAE